MRDKRRIVLRSAVLAALVTSAGQAAPMPTDAADGMAPSIEYVPGPGRLNLTVGDVQTADLPNLLIEQPEAFDRAGRYVIQLDGPMTRERRAALDAMGVELGDYLPTHAYVARLDGVRPADLGDVDFVLWAGRFENAWKVSPGIDERTYATEERQLMQARGDDALVITLFEGEPAGPTMAALEALVDVQVVRSDELAGNMMITATAALYRLDAIAALDTVQYIEPAPEVTFRNSTNRWIVQSNVSGVTPLYDAGIRGEGQVVGVVDGRIDHDHCSFDDSEPIGPNHRKILAYNASLGSDSHGTHVAGTVVGDAGTNNDTRGVAYLGKLVFDTIPSFSEGPVKATLSQHHNQGARVHTNSWGNDGTTQYDSMCRGFDAFIYENEDSLVTLAVTNGSTLRNPENAKNLLAVGASQDTPNQGNHCTGGTGPTSDGRRKPEIYAPGCGTLSSRNNTACSVFGLTGTSMATPAVSGAAMLVREYFVDGYYPSGLENPADGFTPTGTLLKAMLLNSAVDMTGVSGYPSNREGWGRVLLDNSVFLAGDDRKLVVVDVRNADGLNTGDVVDQVVQVGSSDEVLKITLVFTEPPAAAGAGFASINNLDLEVIAPNGTTYLGNVFSGGTSVPGGSADDRNNVEQVHVPSPAVGAWTVRVRGAGVNEGTQGYALVATGDVVGEEPPFTISLPNGTPDTTPPNAGISVDVQISPGQEEIVDGSPTVFVRTDGGGGFTSAPLVDLGDNLYRADLPGVQCDDDLQFYFRAEGDGGTVLTSPPAAPDAFYDVLIGETIVTASDDVETDQGWTVGAPDDDATTGVWNRQDPQGTGAQPEDDHTPSPGVNCWVTDGRAGSGIGTYDIDGGKTTLISPAYDASSLPDPTMSYWRWYSNDQGASPNADIFVVDISNDNGASWTNLEIVGPSGPGTSGGWVFHEFRIADFVTPTDQMRLRFVASDEGDGSIVEAAIDDLLISDFVCDSADCEGDLNGDGVRDLADLGILLASYEVDGGGDIDGDGDTDLADLGALLAVYDTDCP